MARGEVGEQAERASNLIAPGAGWVYFFLWNFVRDFRADGRCFEVQLAPLTFKSIRARAVVLKLKRPVVARIATIADWPLILIDLITEEGHRRAELS
jgi:hypothetical protein